MRDAANGFQGVVCVAQDVTESRQAQMAVRESEQRFRGICSAAQDAIVLMDNDGRVSFWNDAAESMFGYTREEAFGREIHSSDFIVPDRFVARFTKVWSIFRHSGHGTAIGQIRDVVAKRKNGEEFPLELSLSALSVRRRWHSIAILRDVSERTQLELELAQAHKLESVGQLAAGIAHEINTPTQYLGDNTRFLKDAFNDLRRALDGFDRLLQAAKEGAVDAKVLAEVEAILKDAEIEYLTTEIPQAIDQSLNGVERVAKIVSAMKDFSHPGGEEKSLVNLPEAIETTITVARNEWKYVAEMVTEFDPDLPAVMCRPGEMNQVFLNLIVNAAHAIAETQTDDETRQGTITVGTRLAEPWAEIDLCS